MSRTGALVLAAVALVLVLVTVWMSHEGPQPRSPGASAPLPAPAPPSSAGTLDELMLGLQITPLDGAPAKPFLLETVGGERVELAQLAGRPVLLYFWATW